MKKYLLVLLTAFASKAQVPNPLSATGKVCGLLKCWQKVAYNFVYLGRNRGLHQERHLS